MEKETEAHTGYQGGWRSPPSLRHDYQAALLPTLGPLDRSLK